MLARGECEADEDGDGRRTSHEVLEVHDFSLQGDSLMRAQKTSTFRMKIPSFS